MEEEKDIGYVFEAEEPSWFMHGLAILTLGFVFFIALFYAVLIIIALYLWYAYQMTIVFWMALFLLGSIGCGGALVGFVGGFAHETGWLNCLVLRAWRMYFCLRVYKETRIPQTKGVLFTMFPHGVFPLALPIVGGVGKEILPELSAGIPKIAVGNQLFLIPLLGPLLHWIGCISADSQPIREALETGTCLLMPDGVAGIYHSSREREVLYIQRRKGFIRLALETGALLVPIYCFGHTQLFDVFPNKHHWSWLVDLSRRIRFSIVFFLGHVYFPPLPRREPITIVIGRPYQLPLIPEPTEEEVDKVHAQYIERLRDLYERHAAKCGWENKELIIE